MPRYFFNVHDGEHAIPDTDGCELPDLAAARVEAVRASGEMLRDGAQHWTGREWAMIVADRTGTPVMTFHFSAAIAA